MRPFVVALDGPSGTGKSSTARELAARLDIGWLDTGAMYRGLSLRAIEEEIEPGDDVRLTSLAASLVFCFPGLGTVLLDGRDVSRDIRRPEVSRRVSVDCTAPGVRAVLVDRQRELARDRSFVLDGRDIGTVVFPDALRKFFLDCDLSERARRRVDELARIAIHATFEDVLANLQERDRLDRGRIVSPLVMAADAVFVDTTRRTLDEVVELMEFSVREALRTRA